MLCLLLLPPGGTKEVAFSFTDDIYCDSALIVTLWITKTPPSSPRLTKCSSGITSDRSTVWKHSMAGSWRRWKSSNRWQHLSSHWQPSIWLPKQEGHRWNPRSLQSLCIHGTHSPSLWKLGWADRVEPIRHTSGWKTEGPPRSHLHRPDCVWTTLCHLWHWAAQAGKDQGSHRGPLARHSWEKSQFHNKDCSFSRWTVGGSFEEWEVKLVEI